MQNYSWQGIAVNGRTINGEMEAADPLAVYNTLKSRQITAISNKIKIKSVSQKKETKLPSFRAKIKTRDIVLFTRHFATMIEAGLPIIQGLDVLGRQHSNPAMKKVLLGVKDQVLAGSTLADSMACYPKVFDNLFTSMIAAGEAGGILDVILLRFSDYLEKMDILKRQVKTAMIYPAVVLTAGAIVTSVLLIFVIPTFAELFQDFGAALPAPTQFVINLSNAMVSYGYFIFGALVTLIVLFRRIMATDRGKEMAHPILLKIPIFGEIVRKVAVSRLTRTLATLLSAGVPILGALSISGKTSGNKVVEHEIENVKTGIREGRTIVQPLEKSDIFTPMVLQMISVGESTGALDAMLHKVADFYDDEVNNAVVGMKQLIEPLMILFLGALVGGLVIAMYLPIFRLGSVIG